MPSGIPAASIRQYVTYLPCSSVAVLTLTTLIVDLVGPLLGVHEPLRRLPLLVGLNLALPGLAFLGRGAGPSYELYSSDLMDRMPWLWPLLLPLLAVVAAMRLDNGAGNTLAVVILIASAAIICVGTVRANRLDSRQITLLLYGCGLSLMLLTSIRSAYVIGFDINSEYFDFHQTVVTGIWHFGHLNPYEAMLSLTVFPASLHSLIGGQDVWIFKLGYPALFAFFPFAVFEPWNDAFCLAASRSWLLRLSSRSPTSSSNSLRSLARNSRFCYSPVCSARFSTHHYVADYKSDWPACWE